MKTIFVKAAPGLKCPKEGRPRDYITDAGQSEVKATAYYRRLIADGSLVIAETERPKTFTRKKEE